MQEIWILQQQKISSPSRAGNKIKHKIYKQLKLKRQFNSYFLQQTESVAEL